MEEELRRFLSRYLGQGEEKKDYVQQDDIDMLVLDAVDDGVEQKIIDYGTAHPEATFWDLARRNRRRTGRGGLTYGKR